MPKTPKISLDWKNRVQLGKGPKVHAARVFLEDSRSWGKPAVESWEIACKFRVGPKGSFGSTLIEVDPSEPVTCPSCIRETSSRIFGEAS